MEMKMTQRKEWILTVEGMTCEHCAKTIDDAVSRVPGVLQATTKHERGTSRVVVEAHVDAPTLASAIRSQGFTVVNQSVRDLQSRKSGNDEELDFLILGSGSAGFAAAIRARELGASVAMVERGELGGTCVNVGCVPSKTLIRAAEVHHRSSHHGFAGVRTHSEAPDFKAIIEQKRQLVSELQQAKYWDVLAAYPGIMLLRGEARFAADGTVEVDGKPVRARKVLLSMGASSWAPPIPGLADTRFLSSTELMELEELPKHLVVIGAGYVALELGQTFARLGSKVTILARSRLLSHEDRDVSDALTTYLRDEGIAVETGVRIEDVAGGPGAYQISIGDGNGRRVIEPDQLFVAAGRRANTRGMGLTEAGIELGEQGHVIVDEHLETSRPGVYAAGDVTSLPAFVYVAAYAGNLAASNAIGEEQRQIDLTVVPRVTFTDPAVASVGLTEEQAREQGFATMVSNLPMSYVPRAIAARDTRGFIKLVADEQTNRLLGAQILAPEAGDIIQLAVMAIRFGIRVDDIATTLHAYLTNAEGIKLAAQSFNKDVAKLSCCAA